MSGNKKDSNSNNDNTDETFPKEQETELKRLIHDGLKFDEEGSYENAEREYLKAGDMLFRLIPTTSRGSADFKRMSSLFGNIVNRMEELERLKDSVAKRQKQCRRVMEEILKTEASYVQCLTTLHDIFIDPLTERTKFYKRSLSKSTSGGSSGSFLTKSRSKHSTKSSSSISFDDSPISISSSSPSHKSHIVLDSNWDSSANNGNSDSNDNAFRSSSGANSFLDNISSRPSSKSFSWQQALASPNSSPSKSEKEVIPIGQVNQLFMNSAKILEVHRDLLEQFRSFEQQISEDPNTFTIQKQAQTIAEIFIKYIPKFDCYTDYINQYAVSMDLLKTLSQENAEFQDFLQKAHCDPRCNLLEVSDFLIMPVQRLPRYQLLLQELYQFLSPKECTYICVEHQMVGQAIQQIKSVATYINERKREADNMSRMLRIQSKLRKNGSKVHIITPDRQLLKEGILTKLKMSTKEDFRNRKEKDVFIMVFNDLLIFTKKKIGEDVNKKTMTLKYDLQTLILPKDVVEIEEFIDPSDRSKTISTRDLTSDRDLLGKEKSDASFWKLVFFLYFRKSAKIQTYMFKAGTKAEKREWIKFIEQITKVSRTISSPPNISRKQ